MANNKQIFGEYDYELILSRESPVKWRSIGDKTFSIPTFYNPVKNSYYLNISREDLDYYQIISESEKARLVSNNLGPKFLEYPHSSSLQFNVFEILKFPGIKGDSFALRLENREYWRFLFLKERLSEVSEFLLKLIGERSDNEEKKIQTEYLGKPHDLRWYLAQYKYGREVVSVKVLEKLSDEYLKDAPHYSYPFHHDVKIPDFGNRITKTIRFSTGKCESKASLKDQILVREGKMIVTEDTRVGLINTAFFDFENKVFIPALASYCDYDGSESVSTFIIDKSEVNQLLLRIKQSNDITKKLVQLYLQSVEDYYIPDSKNAQL